MALYLESCRRNPQIDWTFFTNCGEPACGWPPNVSCHRMQLSDFLRLAERKAGIEIHWTDPYKICDLRPAFGDVFESWIQGMYDYFGRGDIDVIYGDMAGFLTDETAATRLRFLLQQAPVGPPVSLAQHRSGAQVIPAGARLARAD